MPLSLGAAFAPRQDVEVIEAEHVPSIEDLRSEQLLLALSSLQDALNNMPAPVVNVAEPDLTAIVQAVTQLNGPATAREIAEAVREVIDPAPTPQTDTVLKELTEALERLDFRMKGIGSGGGGGPTTINSDPERQLGKVEVTNFPASSTGLTNTELRAAPLNVQDDFVSGEVLADQVGAGAVLTFTFSSPVNLVWVTDTGSVTTSVSRVNPFGGTPTSTLGIAVFNQAPTPITVVTSTVRVWAPTGATISVYGYRR